jgi:non-canonical purine NTP pyrophosphatase (RdgB/HAM1 family)
MKEIVLVTGNDNKAREVAEILGMPITRVKLDLDEIQSMDLAEVVSDKACRAYAQLKKPVLVEDTGFYIRQWNGFPGPFIKFVENLIGYEALPKMLLKKDRSVDWQVALGYADNSGVKVFIGEITGSLAREKRGGEGFGFDSVFIPAGKRETVSQLGNKLKHTYSPRMLALRKLKRFLNSTR